MTRRRFAGGSEVPPGVYFESWFAHPVCIVRGEGPLPGPSEKRFFRLSPLAVVFLAPSLGALFVMGFLLLTLVAIVGVPFVALRRRRGQVRPGRTTLGFVATLAFLGASWGYAQALPNEACLGCHRNPGLVMRLGDGTEVSLQISLDAFTKSVHGRRLLCTACHQNIKTLPHEPVSFADRRALSLNYSQGCTICHRGKFKEFQESVHRLLLSEGNRQAPLCADCHGAHTVTRGGIARGQVSHTCAKCHGDIYRLYEKSVHGTALIGAGNPDVPTCSTCHLSHTTRDPRKIAFRMDIPKLCADCHRDQSIMAKYGISTHVVSTYLQDFHGVSINLYRRQASPPPRLTAVCTDCHGIHDIRFVLDPESLAGKASLHRTCQGCHPGAPPDFPTAWLSHYIPTPSRAPLVYYVKLFYSIFLPGVLVCVIVHVGLDLIHAAKTPRLTRERKIRWDSE
jgi:predicted CXXCH cytochrome family protein